jgi:hypothetical protein
MSEARAEIRTRPLIPRAGRRPARRVGAHRLLVATELLTGGSALLCGGLLAARPDGSLLGLPASVLAGGPFSDWRLPGLLLGGLVGVGYLGAGALERGRYRWSRPVSVLAGAGLVAFEAVEWRWLGFHPLQAVFMVVGAGVAGLATAGVAASTPSAPIPEPSPALGIPSPDHRRPR